MNRVIGLPLLYLLALDDQAIKDENAFFSATLEVLEFCMDGLLEELIIMVIS